MELKNKYLKLLQDFDLMVARIKRTSKVDSSETPHQRRDRKARLEKRYIAWFEHYFADFAKVRCAWFHAKLAKLIITNRVIRLLAEWYRSAAKSVHIDLGIPLYLYLVKHELNFMLLIGETEPKARRLLSAIQAQLQYNERLKHDYGAKFQGGDWAEGDFATTDGVRFMAIGFGSSPRGAREGAERPDYIAVDDVDSRRHVNNDRLMEDGVNYITEDVWGCFDSTEGGRERFVYANNNFHKNSITNRLKQYFQTSTKRATQEGDPNIFHVMTINAVKNLDTFEPAWPEKTSAEYWHRKFNQTPYRSFMREYMNTHVADGAVFKAEDMPFRELPKLDRYDALTFYGDLSYKDAADYKAMILVGKLGREYHIIYAYVSKGSRAKLAAWLYDLYEKQKLDRFNIRYRIEGLFAMDDFVNDFDAEGDKRGYHIPVVACKRAKADKYDRIEAMAGFFERQNMIFNVQEHDNPHMVTLVDQLLAFAKGSKANDDGPDALQGAVADLNRATFVDRFEPVIVSRAEVRARSKNRF